MSRPFCFARITGSPSDLLVTFCHCACEWMRLGGLIAHPVLRHFLVRASTSLSPLVPFSVLLVRLLPATYTPLGVFSQLFEQGCALLGPRISSSRPEVRPQTPPFALMIRRSARIRGRQELHAHRRHLFDPLFSCSPCQRLRTLSIEGVRIGRNPVLENHTRSPPSTEYGIK